MKRALILLAAVLTLPLLAGEPATKETATPSADGRSAPAPTDSPLVAAAKRTNRLGHKPTNLITNDTLRQSGSNAHLTTTTTPRTIKVSNDPLRPTPEMAAAKAAEIQRKQLEVEAAQKKKAETARIQAQRTTAEAAEEGLYGEADHDPAQAEKAQQDANQQKPPHI